MRLLQKLKIKNFLNTEFREIDFSKNGDVILITGENAKGKTTIMRAIYMCLTGEDAFLGRTNLDNLIRYGSKFFELELEVVRGQYIFSVTIRKEKGKTPQFKILENGELQNTSELADEAKSVLVEIFGTPKNLLNSYFFFSTSDDDIVSVTDSRRLEIITESSKIFEEYEKISQQASIFEKEVGREIIELQGQLVSTNQQAENLNEKYINKVNDTIVLTGLNSYNEEKIEKVIQEQQEKFNELITTKKELLKIKELEKEVTQIQNIDIDSIQKELQVNKENKEFNEGIKAKINDLWKDESLIKEKKLNVMRRVNENEKNEVRITAEKDKYSSLIVEVTDNNLLKTREEVENLERDNKKKEEDREKLLSTWNEIKANIEIKEKEKKKMKELYEHNKVCPVCFSKLSEKAYSLYLETIEKDIVQLIEKKEEVENEGKKLKEEIQSNTSLIENSIQSLRNIQLKEKIKELEVEEKKILSELSEQKKEETYLEKELNQIESKKRELEKSKKTELSDYVIRQKEAIVEKYDSLIQKVALIEELKKKLPDLDIYTLEEKILSIRNNIENIVRNIESVKILTQQKEEIERREDELQEKIKTLNKDKEQYANLIQFFGKNGIQKRQVETILGNVERETNAIINKFFDNITIKFGFSPEKKGISLNFIRQYIDSKNNLCYMEDKIKNFSDAQQEMLRVIIRLAFSRAIQYLHGIPLNMIFFNETFGKLSEDKEGRLQEILKFFGEDNQVLFITHNKNITPYFPEEDVLHLE